MLLSPARHNTGPELSGKSRKRNSPEQLALELLRAARVVLPEGHAWQAGSGVDALPPDDHVPITHSAQFGPP